MINMNRRRFVGTLAGCAGMVAMAKSQGATPPHRKMTINLSCGAIGITANQMQAIELAAKHGFESVDANGDYLAGLTSEQLKDVLDDMKKRGLVFGTAGLSVDFRQDEARFESSLSRLPKTAAGLQRAGVSRVGTYLMPCHDQLTYIQNFKQHARRLKQVTQILKDHGQRLGLEYVGTQTLRNSRKYPFVHTLAETKELIAEIGTGNVGLIMDSWHWWTAGDTEAEILALKADEVVAGDLNDAPAGIPREQQVDGRRELPAATGVINLSSFLGALNKIGFDGPMRAEPFNRPLNDLNNEEACAATAAAMKKAFGLIGG